MGKAYIIGARKSSKSLLSRARDERRSKENERKVIDDTSAHKHVMEHGMDATYVSQMVILTRRLSTFIALTLKSTPIVGCIGSKTSSVNRRRMLDFPTPLSPTSKILKVSSNSMPAEAGRGRIE